MNRSLIAALCLTTALGTMNFGMAAPYNGLPLWGKKEASGKWHVDQVQDQDTCKSVDESAKNANPHPQIIDRDSGVYLNAFGCSWANNQCLCDTTPTLVIATPPAPSATAPTSQPSPKEREAFVKAAERGDLEAVKAWVAQGRDVNAKNDFGRTVLMLAIEKGHLPVVKYLLEQKADVNTKDNFGTTALMLASENGHLPVVEYLVEQKVDVNAKENVFEITALMLASERGHLPVVEYLVGKGADVNAKNNKGNTALMWASESGYLPVVQHLVDKGADVNAKNNNGKTALIGASTKGHLTVVQHLVDKGADVNAKNNKRQTARDWALNSVSPNKQDIVALLDKAMKDSDPLKKQELWDARVKALKDGGFLTDPAKAGMNAQELAEFKDAITCPISLDIMRDPVRTKTGTKNAQGQEIYTHAYEREDLEAWLDKSPQDPTTRQHKKISDYEPDADLAKRIQIFMDKHVPQEKP